MGPIRLVTFIKRSSVVCCCQQWSLFCHAKKTGTTPPPLPPPLASPVCYDFSTPHSALASLPSRSWVLDSLVTTPGQREVTLQRTPQARSCWIPARRSVDTMGG
ncbi:unnamed protein product [Lota lota]